MREVQLTKGYKALVDDDDFERINSRKWFAVETITGPNSLHVSAVRWSSGSYPLRKSIRMAYEVLHLTSTKGILIDHINRDSLDNQKLNLRIANKSLNSYNSNRSINASGIYLDKRRYRWKAFLLRPVKKYVGTFKTKLAAEEALNNAKAKQRNLGQNLSINPNSS